MTAIRICFVNFASWVGLIFWAAPAHADYLASWVATTCDLQSGRAAVRFGYADADAQPLFVVQATPSLDDGISTIPVTNASQRDASCKLKNGTEVKIRLGSGYDAGDQFSVWVNGIRIAQGTIGDNNLPYEILVYPDGFRFCKFQLPPDHWVYDVTAAAQKPTPIHCDATLTPISGTRDLVEYPADPRLRRPETGSIVVAKANAPFCKQMIIPAPPNANFKFYVTIPETLGQIIDLDGSGAPIYVFRSDLGDSTHVGSALVDFWDTEGKNAVYLFNSGHTFDTSFIVVPDVDTTQDEVLRVASLAGDWGSIEQAVSAKGWSVYTAAGTPYDQQEQIGIRVVRINNASYLLYGASRGSEKDPVTVLMKPQRDGKLTTVCKFQEIRPHF